MSRRLAEFDRLGTILVEIAVQAGCLSVDPETGEIRGMYDPDAEDLAYLRVAASVRRGELGFVDPDEVMERIETIVADAHPQIED